MTKRISYPKYEINSEAELQGTAVMSLIESQNLYNFQDLVEKYGYTQINAEEWYSLERLLQFLHELTSRHSATENMVSIGMKVFDVAPMPPEIKTIVDALRTFNVMNTIIQRNVKPERAWYEIEELDDTHIKFTDMGPYPHDLVYGELYSLIRRMRPAGSDFSLKREYLNADDPDSDGAIYHIEIKK